MLVPLRFNFWIVLIQIFLLEGHTIGAHHEVISEIVSMYWLEHLMIDLVTAITTCQTYTR